MQRLWFGVVMLAGCGRIDFELRDDASSTGDATFACDWTNGPNLGTPQLHDELSLGSLQFDPFLVPGDPLTLYFASNRDGTFDEYVAHRSAVGAAFDPPTKIVGLDSGTLDELGFNTDVTATHGYFSIGYVTAGALYEASRASPTSPVQIVRKLDELFDNTVQYDAFASPDGLELTFSKVAPIGTLDIFFATRPDPTAMWSNVQPFVGNTTGDDAGATLTADRRVIVWASSGQGSDLFYATRPSATAAFGPKQVLISTPVDEMEPVVRDDGCELFFVANAPHQIYSVEIAF